MGKTASWILGLIAVAVVGITSYKAGQKSVTTNVSESAIEEKVKNDLIALTQKDFEEYKNLKTMEERYKKADEILGKIVTVFLADLGVRLGYKPSNPALLEGSCAIPGLNVTPTPSATPQQSNMSTPEPTPSPTPKKPKWILNEVRIAHMDREEDMLSLMKKEPITDLFDTLKSSRDVNRNEALAIQGRFQGEISFFDHKAHKSDWIVYWEVNVKSGTDASGSSLVTLTRKSDGNTFSRSRSGSGPFNNFMRPAGSQALIVNVYGDDGYIQIYQVGGSSDVWAGNYYEKDGKIGQYKMAGQVTLNRLQ